jgi:hypothetical protein
MSRLPDSADTAPQLEIVSGGKRYRKADYSPPEIGALYSVRDKTGGDRIIRVRGANADGTVIEVEALDEGRASTKPVQIAVDALSRQAEKGLCCLLLPVTEGEEAPDAASQPATSDTVTNVIMRLDIQNFSRCCADIVRSNIKFDTQLIKDVAEGPFRAGNYGQAFLTIEQCAVGFTAAVSNSRRAIADGRRALNAAKNNLSGKEIQERTAAFVRSERLINTAERSFSTILEGLRMYLRAQPD